MKIETNTDFIMDSLQPALLRAGAKHSGGGWDFNCPMCVSRGETPDKRQRCRVFCSMAQVGASCFNCGFRTRYVVGKAFPRNLEALLINMHVPQRDVLKIAHRARLIRNMGQQQGAAVDIVLPQYGVYPPMRLPPGSKPLEDWAADPVMGTNPDLCEVISYLGSRGHDIATAMTYYWTPETKNDLNKRLIIPMHHDGKIVGWTARACKDGINPKYHTEVPENFLFNASALTDPHRKFVIVMEGPMDGIALDAISPLGASLNDVRVRWLNEHTDKIKIVVADRDKAGQRKDGRSFIDTALANDWHVAFPRLGDGKGFQNWWEPDVKDVAQAVQKYGRLYVLRSVIQSATNNKMEINMKRNRII